MSRGLQQRYAEKECTSRWGPYILPLYDRQRGLLRYRWKEPEDDKYEAASVLTTWRPKSEVCLLASRLVLCPPAFSRPFYSDLPVTLWPVFQLIVISVLIVLTFWMLLCRPVRLGSVHQGQRQPFEVYNNRYSNDLLRRPRALSEAWRPPCSRQLAQRTTLPWRFSQADITKQRTTRYYPATFETRTPWSNAAFMTVLGNHLKRNYLRVTKHTQRSKYACWCWWI